MSIFIERTISVCSLDASFAISIKNPSKNRLFLFWYFFFPYSFRFLVLYVKPRSWLWLPLSLSSCESFDWNWLYSSEEKKRILGVKSLYKKSRAAVDWQLSITVYFNIQFKRFTGDSNSVSKEENRWFES